MEQRRVGWPDSLRNVGVTAIKRLFFKDCDKDKPYLGKRGFPSRAKRPPFSDGGKALGAEQSGGARAGITYWRDGGFSLPYGSFGSKPSSTFDD